MVCQNAKGCFFGMFFVFWCFCFLLPVFWFLCFVKKAQKGYFPAVLEVFCLFCSHKRPALKCFISSYFVFFLLLSSFSTIHFYIFCCPSTTFWKTLMFLVSFFFFFLPFPFLMFACFFQTNFPNIPFSEIQFVFVFGCFFFLLVVLVFVFIVYVLAFLFFCCYVGFVFGVFLLFCFVFLSLFFFLVLLSVSEKRLFSLQFWCFFELCWLKG